MSMVMDCNCNFAKSLFKKVGYLEKRVRFLEGKSKRQRIIIQNLQRKLRKFEDNGRNQGHDQGQTPSKEVISMNSVNNVNVIALPEGRSDLKSTYKPRPKKIRKEYVLNPAGKTAVSILHEYAQCVLGQSPIYQIDEVQSALTPYSATVTINGLKYGTGYGASKKLAKLESAKATIEILIPELKGHFDQEKNKNDQDTVTNLFDQVKMDDSRISDICSSLNEPLPFALLLTCLKRNFGQTSDTDTPAVTFETLSLAHKNNRFKMDAAGHSVEIQALNKNEGKQLASQLLLTKIHPEIKNFSSFLRLYGNGSVQTVQEKKKKMKEIISLQNEGPNYSLIDKLKEEMTKLRGKTCNNLGDLKNKNNARIPGGNSSTSYSSKAEHYDENASQNQEQMNTQSSQDQTSLDID